MYVPVWIWVAKGEHILSSLFPAMCVSGDEVTHVFRFDSKCLLRHSLDPYLIILRSKEERRYQEEQYFIRSPMWILGKVVTMVGQYRDICSKAHVSQWCFLSKMHSESMPLKVVRSSASSDSTDCFPLYWPYRRPGIYLRKGWSLWFCSMMAITTSAVVTTVIVIQLWSLHNSCEWSIY